MERIRRSFADKEGFYLKSFFTSRFTSDEGCFRKPFTCLPMSFMASCKATTRMSLLMSMVTQKAILAQNGEIVDAKDVEVNTLLAMKAGEVIPIDGIVVVGRCKVDEKILALMTLAKKHCDRKNIIRDVFWRNVTKD
ncbi:putative cadmium/zinc-transporting ATPase HMA4 [Platanthera guangdongensis]|uniref:Cadmium/zinc-transporting ATPase HMA4 n=1 Tax=Platanthera guangdongensis TaxID=2320717 RepID=A0ABR2N3N0_9ASPA